MGLICFALPLTETNDGAVPTAPAARPVNFYSHRSRSLCCRRAAPPAALFTSKLIRTYCAFDWFALLLLQQLDVRMRLCFT